MAGGARGFACGGAAHFVGHAAVSVVTLGRHVVSKTLYFGGLDVGLAQQPTALAVLERTEAPDPRAPGRLSRHYAVRHLERFPLGTPLPDVAARVAWLFA